MGYPAICQRSRTNIIINGVPVTTRRNSFLHLKVVVTRLGLVFIGHNRLPSFSYCEPFSGRYSKHVDRHTATGQTPNSGSQTRPDPHPPHPVRSMSHARQFSSVSCRSQLWSLAPVSTFIQAHQTTISPLDDVRHPVHPRSTDLIRPGQFVFNRSERQAVRSALLMTVFIQHFPLPVT